MTVVEDAVAKSRDCHRALEALCEGVGETRRGDPRACIIYGLLRAAVAVLAELIYMFETAPQPPPPKVRRGRR